MKKLVFVGVVLSVSMAVFWFSYSNNRYLSGIGLENLEALSDNENLDSENCAGTGSVDCAAIQDGKLVTIKVEKKIIYSRIVLF